MRGTWQTTGGGSGAGVGPAVIVGLVLFIAGSAGGIAHAVSSAADVVLHIVLITAAVLAGISVAGIGIALVWRSRRQVDPERGHARTVGRRCCRELTQV